MKKQVMIHNRTDFSMNDIYEYLAGNTTKFRDVLDKIKTVEESGQYYDSIYVIQEQVEETIGTTNDPKIQKWWDKMSLEQKQILTSLYNFIGNRTLKQVYEASQRSSAKFFKN